MRNPRFPPIAVGAVFLLALGVVGSALAEVLGQAAAAVLVVVAMAAAIGAFEGARDDREPDGRQRSADSSSGRLFRVAAAIAAASFTTCAGALAGSSALAITAGRTVAAVAFFVGLAAAATAALATWLVDG
jgi:Na+-driven multidrug efflux pump